MDLQIQESTDPVTLYFKDNEDKCAAVLSRDTTLNIFSLLLVEPRDAGCGTVGVCASVYHIRKGQGFALPRVPPLFKMSLFSKLGVLGRVLLGGADATLRMGALSALQRAL